MLHKYVKNTGHWTIHSFGLIQQNSSYVSMEVSISKGLYCCMSKWKCLAAKSQLTALKRLENMLCCPAIVWEQPGG